MISITIEALGDRHEFEDDFNADEVGIINDYPYVAILLGRNDKVIDEVATTLAEMTDAYGYWTESEEMLLFLGEPLSSEYIKYLADMDIRYELEDRRAAELASAA